MIWKYYGQIYDYGDDDGLDYLDRNGELWNQLMDKYNGEIDDIVAGESTEVLMQAAQELKGIAGDMKYELDEAAQGHTIEAHGVRGMDRRTWHKTFKNTEQMIAWAEKHDAEIMGTRDLEQARHHNLSHAEQGMDEGVVDTVKKIGKKLIKPVEVPGLNQMKAIHNAELKRELAAQNKKYAPKDVKEGSRDVVQVHQHQHGKDMGKYGAFNIERETPTVIVVYDHNTGEMLKFNRITGRGIGPASQLMIRQGVAEGSDYTPPELGTVKANLMNTQEPTVQVQVFKHNTLRGDSYWVTKEVRKFKTMDQAQAYIDRINKQGVAEGSKVKTAKGYGDVVQGTDVKTIAKADLGKNKLNLPKGYGDVVQPQKLKTIAKAKDVKEGETSTPAIYVKGGGKYPGMTIAPKGWTRIRDIKDEGDSYFVMVGNDGDGLNIPKDKVSPHQIKLKNGMPITAKQAFMMFNGWTPDREQGVAEGFDSAAFDRHMDRLRAQKELEKTDPMRALVNKMHSDDAHSAKMKRHDPSTDNDTNIHSPFHPSQGVNIGEQGVAEGEIERQHGDIKPWAYWSFPERVAKKLYQIHKGQPIGKTAIVQLWKTDGPDRMTKFMFKPDVSAILSAYQQMSEQGPLFKPGVAEADKHSFIGRIQRHNELKNKVDRTWRDAVDAENKGDKSGATRAFNKHVRYTNLERPGTWRTVKDQDQDITEMDKSEPSAGRDTGPRSGPDREAKPITSKQMQDQAFEKLKQLMSKPEHMAILKRLKTKEGVAESDTLMMKLKRAMVKEGRVKELADDLKTMADADFMKKYGKAKAAIRKDMNKLDEAPINELSTNKLAQYKTAAAKDATAADKAGDVKRGDKRFGGIVKATKKQFDNDAKKVDESRAARRALMAQIVKGN